WLNELVIYAFAAMFMLGAAAALRDDDHVRVDILRPRFGAAGRNWIELAGIYLFLFPIMIRILTTGEQGLARSWSLLEGSRESDGLPFLYLFKTLVPAFAVLMLAQGLSEALKAALRLTGRLEEATPPSATEGAHGA
ncbi:MAG: TRAP transporter small permease subunit, partial [Hyphomonas sp.]|nr:TRAP transporter small permease subunit [Hyphomonas sp.]